MSKVILKNARVSYANGIFTKKAMQEGAAEKYQCQIIIPKDHPQINEVKKAIEEAKKDKFKGKSDKALAKLKTPLRDGEEKEDLDDYEAVYENTYWFNASSRNKPITVNRSREEITEEDNVIYSGCYCNFILNFYGYDVSGNKGVAVGLNGVQFKGDGDPLGSSTRITDFDIEEDEFDEAKDLY